MRSFPPNVARLKFPFHRIAPALIFLMIVILDGMKQTRYDGLIRSPSAALRFNFVIARTRKGGSRTALTIETIVLLTFYEIISYNIRNYYILSLFHWQV